MSEHSGLITAESLSKLTGYSPQWLLKLAKDGYYPPAEKGMYQLAPSLRGLFRYNRELIQRGAGIQKVRERKENLLCDMLEIRKNERSGNLVTLDEIYKALEFWFLEIRGIVLGSQLETEDKDRILASLRNALASRPPRPAERDPGNQAEDPTFVSGEEKSKNPNEKPSVA